MLHLLLSIFYKEKLANIISIGTALPAFCHEQDEILHFMQSAHRLNETESRKLAFLYRHSEIQKRYSIIDDFSKPEREWKFIKPGTIGPCLDCRLKLFDEYAPLLSIDAIMNCIEGFIKPGEITHLISVSCTGMSAPGLDLQVAEALQLPSNVFRTSVNFMGCYAAIHALKLAKMICESTTEANVVIVCTELCTIHFQQEYTQENAASALLFGDGSAAVLVSNKKALRSKSLRLKSFYSEIAYEGKEDMAWKISNKGFLMKLSSYIPQLIKEDIQSLVSKALAHGELQQNDITHWCLHPGGKKILEVIQAQLKISDKELSSSKKVLAEYGNMSSPTILFVLQGIMRNICTDNAKIFGVAFGPGLTMETFIAEVS